MGTIKHLPWKIIWGGQWQWWWEMTWSESMMSEVSPSSWEFSCWCLVYKSINWLHTTINFLILYTGTTSANCQALGTIPDFTELLNNEVKWQLNSVLLCFNALAYISSSPTDWSAFNLLAFYYLLPVDIYCTKNTSCTSVNSCYLQNIQGFSL